MVFGKPSLDMSPLATPSLPTALLKTTVRERVTLLFFRITFEVQQHIHLMVLLQQAERVGGSPVVLPRCLIVTWYIIPRIILLQNCFSRITLLQNCSSLVWYCASKLLLTSQWPQTEETMGKRVFPRRPENATPRYLIQGSIIFLIMGSMPNMSNGMP